MKLLCINAGNIQIGLITYIGEHLKEGEEYETKGEPFIEADGEPCYYIVGLGGRLCCRFTKLLDESEIAVNKLKEEFQLN